MKSKLYCKHIAVGIIVLFIGISFIPEINANDNYTDDIDDKSIDNFEFGTEDDYEEIITFVRGEAHPVWINRKGPFRGSLRFGMCPRCKGLELSGLRHSNGFIERYNIKLKSTGIEIPNFIGIPEITFGIAIGDIEIMWELKNQYG